MKIFKLARVFAEQPVPTGISPRKRDLAVFEKASLDVPPNGFIHSAVEVLDSAVSVEKVTSPRFSHGPL
jgi:hypothetical protein